MADDALVRINDWARAQQLPDVLSPDRLHRTLDRYAEQCCPVCEVFEQAYHWSLMQVEYATDFAFHSTKTLVNHSVKGGVPLFGKLLPHSLLRPP